MRNWKSFFDILLFDLNFKIWYWTQQIFVCLVVIILFILILIKLYKIKNKRFDTGNSEIKVQHAPNWVFFERSLIKNFQKIIIFF